MTDLDALLRAIHEHPEESMPRLMLVDELLENYDGTLPPIPPAVWFEIAHRLYTLPQRVMLTHWPAILIRRYDMLRTRALDEYGFAGLNRTIQERYVFQARLSYDSHLLSDLEWPRAFSDHDACNVLRAFWPTVEFELAPILTLDLWHENSIT